MLGLSGVGDEDDLEETYLEVLRPPLFFHVTLYIYIYIHQENKYRELQTFCTMLYFVLLMTHTGIR